MFAHFIPAHHQSGAVWFLGVALSFPSTYSAAWVLFQAGVCNLQSPPAGIKTSVGINQGWQMAALPRKWNPFTGHAKWEKPKQLSVISSITVTIWAHFTERTCLAQSDPYWVSILFVFAGGRSLSESFRLISLIVLMWEKEEKKSPAVLVASKYLSSLGNGAESEVWVHIQDEFLLLLVLCPFPHCFPHANKGPFWCPLFLFWPGQEFQLCWFASQLTSASPSNLSWVEKGCHCTSA